MVGGQSPDVRFILLSYSRLELDTSSHTHVLDTQSGLIAESQASGARFPKMVAECHVSFSLNVDPERVVGLAVDHHHRGLLSFK